tara:strand:+ start:1027 stop:2892 length:1866 start_codon:yes stop_codon:yes gene_type:complete
MATNLKKRDIKYINKDFSELRQSLIDYSRTYFPTTYNDFTPASPGMMFMEMAAYVGDVLSFYMDNQIQENFLQYARQPNNLYELAYMFGYTPNVTQVATTNIEVFQQLPASGSSPNIVPDFSYALFVQENSTLSSPIDSTIEFLIEEPIDFSVSSSTDPTEVSVLTVDGSGNPTFFLLKKIRKAISSTINETEFSFTTPTQFSTRTINEENIVGVLDITDSDGNEWYEVPYLGQEMVFDSIKNTNVNDPNFSEYNDAPYLLKLEQQQRRFVTRFLSSGSLQLQFGAGTANDNDEKIIPNPENVGIGLPFEKNKLTTAFSPSNFLFTKTYGIAPSNTTLTVRYLTGGGVTANIQANALTNFTANIQFLNSNLDPTTSQTIFDSVQVTNPEAADGGGDGDTLQEIRENASANFGAQLRNVTQDDYLVRALSMPSKYGVISKAFIEPTKIQNISAGESNSVLDLYVLSYNINNQLALTTKALKQNLSTYLSVYRMVNDSINIKDGFIVNIGVNFDIIVLPEFNNNQVLTNCITALQNYFAIDNWSINQPIILRDIFVLLDQIEGVQTVKTIDITNKVGENLGYSQYSYDISSATSSNVIYPSLDPMIFEVKYPNTDIQGRVVPL